jgi:hypothetical protein
MKKALILHTVEDAKHCVENGLHDGNLLFSTHSSVDVYLGEFYGLDCRCLSSFLSPEEVINLRDISFEAVPGILKNLDAEVSPLLNRQFDLNMRYFVPLYSYLGKCHYWRYACFVEAVKKVVDIYKLNKILFYDHIFNDFFCVSSDIEQCITMFFDDLEVRVIKYTKDIDSGSVYNLKKYWSVLKKIKTRPFHRIKNKLDRIRKDAKFRRFSNDKKTVLLYESLYNLHFLLENLNKYNVLYYKTNSKSPLGFKYRKLISNVNVDFQSSDYIENEKDLFARIFLKDIKEDFLENIVEYINAIIFLKEINEKYPVSLGIWGNSPVSQLKALIFEYLKSENIKILGGQHGSVYGEAYKLLHFDTDFNRCDYFISYGFTKEDISRLYPDKEIRIRILPFGMTTPANKNKDLKKDIDILFPITNTMTMFKVGMMRISPDKLADRQVRLLEYLNTLKGLNIYVKPFIGSNYNNCSVLPVLKRLKNLKVVDCISLTEFIEKYNPKAVIIEYPSSPLIDVLHLDAEIFLMGDYMHPYEHMALEELEKRVHYSEDIDEIISKITLFLKGGLREKRDNTYYNHYVYKKNTKENVLDFIEEIVEKEDEGY